MRRQKPNGQVVKDFAEKRKTWERAQKQAELVLGIPKCKNEVVDGAKNRRVY